MDADAVKLCLSAQRLLNSEADHPQYAHLKQPGIQVLNVADSGL